MKTLVFADVHHRIATVDAVIARESYDTIVFTGDFFDARGELNTFAACEKTAHWLKESLKDARRTHIWGNHDVSYGFKQGVTICSGYTREKAEMIRSVISLPEFDKFKFFHIEQNWLLTHAGFHEYYLPPQWQETDITLDNITKYFTEEAEKFRIDVTMETRHWFIRAGAIREGTALYGGLLWCDSREFAPVPSVSQIFGHTVQHGYPSIIDAKGNRINSLDLEERENTNEGLPSEYCQKDGWNVCLDSNAHHYGVIENGCLTIKPSILV